MKQEHLSCLAGQSYYYYGIYKLLRMQKITTLTCEWYIVEFLWLQVIKPSMYSACEQSNFY